jgi:hypothetical protein
MVLSDLCFGTVDGGALGNNLGDRFSSNSMSQRKGRAVSRGVLLSAVAVELATLTEPRGQKTGAQVIDAGQTRDELIAFISECLQGKSHRSLLSDRHYKLSDKKRKPQSNSIRRHSGFLRRAPRVMGGVAAYLLIGVTWAFGYKLLLEIIPNAIHFQTPLAAGVATGEPGRLIYFSFETLTTVAFGDAYPVHRIARSLAIAEALIGQLYPAILIATLVGMALQVRFNAALEETEFKKPN